MESSIAYRDAAIVLHEGDDAGIPFVYQEFDAIVNAIRDGRAHYVGAGLNGEEIYTRLDTVQLVIKRTATQWRAVDEYQRARRAVEGDAD